MAPAICERQQNDITGNSYVDFSPRRLELLLAGVKVGLTPYRDDSRTDIRGGGADTAVGAGARAGSGESLGVMARGVGVSEPPGTCGDLPAAATAACISSISDPHFRDRDRVRDVSETVPSSTA